MALILASSSAFRKQQLANLGLNPTCHAPNIDEVDASATTPAQLAERLSVTKALAVADKFPNDLIIGSDQVAWFQERQVHKPITEAKAKAELRAFSGQTLHFYSGLALYNAASGQTQSGSTLTTVKFRNLTEQEIDSVIARDSPLHCAGSFKVEQLGILLFESVHSDDPSALVGLPLIMLNHFLLQEGYNCLRDTPY